MQINSIEAKGILTKSNLPVGDYSVNPYGGCTHACKYCYASFMKRFTNHSEPWGEYLDVKYWPKIKDNTKYKGKEVFIGSVTDPYNSYEEVYGRTKEFLEQMQGSGIKLSITTKSDLIVRDLDLIKTFKNPSVAWSINTLDEEFRSAMDKAVSIERRFKAMETFHNAGIRTACFISPIFPGLTDVEAIIERAKDVCDEIWLENLNLRGSFKTIILDYIKENKSELVPLYEEIYNKNNRTYWFNLEKELKAYVLSLGFPYVYSGEEKPKSTKPVVVNFFYHELIRKSSRKDND